MPFAAVGPDGLLVDGLATVPNKLASTVMNSVADPVIPGNVLPVGDVVFAFNVPEVMAICTSCDVAGGAFWCGFHSDGINQASNGYAPLFVVQ